MSNNALYSRQRSLNLAHYDNIIIIGAGGIGNWVALDVALSGCAGNIYLIDPDIVEESNLNRTFFDYSDIGSYKVDAVSKHITLRRPEQSLLILREYMDDVLAKKLIQTVIGDNSYYHSNCCIIDCRDDVYDDCYQFNCKLYKVGYDGMSISIDGNPRLTAVFGQRGGSYTITPSYIGSAQLAAILVCNDIFYPKINSMTDTSGVQRNHLNVNNNIDLETFPYINHRACFEYDECGRLNDTVNIDCSDLIFKNVVDKHEYVIPNNDYSNLPNNIS